MSSSQAGASSSTSYAAANSAAAVAAAYSAIPDTQLGLTNEEIYLLRQGQQTVAAAGATTTGAAPSAAAGSSSSRAASRASSQQQGLLLLDPGSLVALGRHFDRVMAQLGAQIQYLSEQAQVATTLTRDRAGLLAADADAEIARFEAIMAQLDELELDFDRVARIGEIVRGFRARAEMLERELDAMGATPVALPGGAPGPSSSGRHRRHHAHSGHARQRR